METEIHLPCDVLVHVALDEEYEALLRHIPIQLQPPEQFERFFVRRGSIRHNDGQLRTVVFLVSGEVGDRVRELGTLAARAFRPEYLINVGISGIVNGDAKVGDVVLPVEFLNYVHRSKAHPANEKDDDWDLQLGGKLVDADLHPVNDIKQLYTSGKLTLPTISEYCTANESLRESERNDIESFSTPNYVSDRPKILSGQIAAGPIVAKSRAFMVSQIRAKSPDALAIDMESGPLADALRVLKSPAPLFVSIRAISDPGDSQKAKFDALGHGVFRRWAIANIASVLTVAIRSLGFAEPSTEQAELDSAALSSYPETLAQTFYVPHFIGQAFEAFDLNDQNVARFPNLTLLMEDGLSQACSARDFVELLKGTNANANIALRGQSGSGKSALFYLTMRHLNSGSSPYVAIYVDLDQILRTTKPTDLSAFADSLRRDVQAFLDNHPDKTTLILLLDGCVGDEREHDLQGAIKSVFSQRSVVTVYAEAINQIRNAAGGHRSNESYLGSLEYISEFELKAISLRAENDAKALIVGFLNSIPRGKAFISADAVYAKLLSLGFDYVTHYVISLFLENYTKPAYRKLETATQFIEVAMKSLIPAGQTLASRVSYEDVCYEALCVHSKDLLRHRAVDQGIEISKIYWAIFARQPRLVQTVMIASAVIGLFSSVGTGGAVLEQQKIDRQTFLQIVFDNDVNASIKHFMLDSAVERRLLSSAKMLANELDFDSLSFSLYLLGRITSTRNRTSALETLQAVRSLLEGDVSPERRRKRRDDLELRYEQLAMRSLYISLASHRDQHATDTYIAKLVADPVEDELNRGFHLEYYGDRRSDDIGVDLQFSDDHKRWHRTASYLLEHIREASKAKTLTPINQIRLVTYLSFVRARHEACCLSDEDRLATLELIDTLDECCAKLDGSAPSYVEMVRRNLQFPSFDTLDFIIRLYALKGAPRAGWASRNIMVQDRHVETVAAHSFACAVLAEILLDPSDEHWQAYKVEHVRTLALLHDIGEFSIGDYLPADKTSVNEAREIAYIATMGSYEKIRDLSYVRDLFNEYEAQSTPESRLARELDKMDALIQAHIYQTDFPDLENYRAFMLWHFKQIHDTRLRDLVARIVP